MGIFMLNKKLFLVFFLVLGQIHSAAILMGRQAAQVVVHRAMVMQRRAPVRLHGTGKGFWAQRSQAFAASLNSLKNAGKGAGVAVANKVKEDPKRALYTAAGGVVGYNTAGDNWRQKFFGTCGGMYLGGTLAKHGSRLKDVQTRVKDIQSKVTDLHNNAARKSDLSAAVREMKTHVTDVVKAGTERTRQTLCALIRAGNGMEGRLSAQMKAGFEENKALHTKAFDTLSAASGRVKDLWQKWNK